MDDNKLNKLREIGYSINKCCGMCEHGKFPSNEWGTCGIQFYDHKKHEGGNKGTKRNLSINRYGSCQQFKSVDIDLYGLHAYKEFYEKI